jgi:uncharacterized protein
MKRRSVLLAALPLLPPRLRAAENAIDDASREPVHRLATAWRVPAPAAETSADRVGIIEVDWQTGRARVLSELAVAGRAHGLLALPDGGFLAVANRPGRWVLRCDAAGRLLQRLDIANERPARTFNGHVESGADAAWLYTTETDPTTGTGWVSVRDARTLARVAEFQSAGIDPHQLVRTADGALMVANGGIPRDDEGRKIELDRMAPSLVRLDPRNGELLGLWRMADPRLSVRHLAWAAGETPLLGVALQAEHDAADVRRDAPTLAVWNGQRLHVASADARGGGYAGDLAAGPGGGFVLSAQKVGRGLWWHPGAPEQLTLVAELTEPCALAPWPGGAGVLIGAARGIARWHARLAPRMLPWPVPMVLDNHWVVLART